MDNTELINYLGEQFGKIDNKFTSINQQFEQVFKQLDRMEKSQQQDVIGILKSTQKKIDHVAFDIDYLRNQTSKHDMDIERLKKQMGS